LLGCYLVYRGLPCCYDVIWCIEGILVVKMLFGV
jgi:hypothetical protein